MPTKINIEQIDMEHKLTCFYLDLNKIQTKQRGTFSYSEEIDTILRLITTSIGQHFKNKSTTLEQKKKILDMATAVLTLAATWDESHTNSFKAKRLDFLISTLKPMVDQVKTKSVFPVFFSGNSKVISSSAEKLIKDIGDFRDQLNKATEQTAKKSNNDKTLESELINVRARKKSL